MAAPTLAWQPSPVQQEVLRFPDEPLDHLYIIGGKGSGKTSAGLRSWIGGMLELPGKYAAEGLPLPAQMEHLVATKGTRQMKAVIRKDVADYLRWLGIPHRMLENQWTIASGDPHRPHVVYPTVFGEVGSHAVAATIQGLNLCSAYVDEVENCGKPFRDELCDRLRVGPHPQALWSGNPTGGLRSLFKREMVDNRRVNGRLVTMPVLPGSPWLPVNWIERLEARYTQDWERAVHIRGEWAAPVGLVFPNAWRHYDDGGNVVKAARLSGGGWFAGVDFASNTVTAAVLCYWDGIKVHVVDEWILDARTDAAMTPQEMAEAMRDKFAVTTGGEPVALWTVDASSSSIQLALERLGQVAVGSGQTMGRHIRDGIEKMKALFGYRNLLIDPRCDHLLDEMATYRYEFTLLEEVHAAVNNPLHADCDAVDALRYAIEWVPVRDIVLPGFSAARAAA